MGIFGKKKHDIIEVQFFDLSTQKLFAQSSMPIGQLPKSFEASTTLHLAKQDWSVVEARPVTAAEFCLTGKLVLVLSKITRGIFDPSTILFSLPTITNDALPSVAAGTSKLGVDVIEIHEDDWRQIEWLPASASGAIESEMDQVNRILTNERKGSGFHKCHLRSAIPALSADRAISFREFRAAMRSNAVWLAGFGYHGVAGVADHSFAVRLFSSIEMFGVESVGGIESICFANTRANNAPEGDVDALADFATAHELLLVDWCQALVVPPSAPDYMWYFSRASENDLKRQ